MESRGGPLKPVTVVSVGDTAAAVIDELARRPGQVHIVRRCPELAELLAACQSGLAQVAVVAAFAEELTATLVDRLAAVGVSVVAVAASAEEARRLRSIGACAVSEQVTAGLLGDAIRAAVEGRRHPGSAGYAVPAAADAPALTHDAGPPPSAVDVATGGDAGENPTATSEVGADGTAPITDAAITGDSRAGVGSAVSFHAGPDAARRDVALEAGLGKGAGPATAPKPLGLAGRMARGLHLGRSHGTSPASEGHRVAGPARAANSAGPRAEAGAPPGTLVAVWGPIGSPGRTTLAVNLAAEQAAAGRSVLLIDADSYGASIAAVLGLLDESASFAQACRAADQGGFSAAQLAKTATQVVFSGGTFSLLTGLTRADRWPELRAAAVERVLDLARGMADLVVVDCGFALESDEELSYDTVAPRRNAATLMVLAQADIVYAVGNGDPVGIPRLIRGLHELGSACPAADVRVVVNKVRRRAVGGRPEKSLAQAWERFGPARGISHFLPWDPELTDRALLEGRLLLEIAADSALSRGIRAMSCAADQRNAKGAVTNATARVEIRG
ncbi:hypothetical protein AAGW05_00555 [Arthrobacter sp. LAPM80]|uniref:AAA family ATPase n=1 Tax=Arthrobacter sp. LAPM80 TaxID=3141788 RepID=UPI00398B32F6